MAARTTRIALLSTSLPPFTDSQAIRTLYLLHQLTRPRFEWVLVAPGARVIGSDDLAELVPDGARYRRTGRTAHDVVKDFLSDRPLRRWTVPLFTNAWYRLALPDTQAGWHRQAVAAFEQEFGAALPDVIVSASGSATAHLAAAELCERHRIPWVADFGDPWAILDREHRPWASWWSARVERRTIRRAARVIFTTAETQDAYRAWLGGDLPASVVLPYGFLRADFPDDPPFTPSGPVTISHVGAAYVANRNLLPTIRAIAALRASGGDSSGVTFRAVGNQSRIFAEEAARLGMTDAIFPQRVGYGESVEWIRRTDVVLVVGNDSRLQVPGKIFPALASGKPILYVGQVRYDEDPAWRILARFGGVSYARNDETDLRRTIADIVVGFRDLRVAAIARRSDPRLAEYDAGALSRRFGAVLEDVAR